MAKLKANPYKPGAGHSPPHLAGRKDEVRQFRSLLNQEEITQNIVLTGIRGVGKTVLMDDEYKPLAIKEGWVWIGSDFSETAFVDEHALCTRLFRDLAVFSSKLTFTQEEPAYGLQSTKEVATTLTFDALMGHYNQQPGLSVDKLKGTLEFLWPAVEQTGHKGVLFAYDEAQVVQDRTDKDQYPLATLLQTFQSLQRKGMRYMLLLTGLPTLFPKLVESRTYAERMFTVQEIGKLSGLACQEAIEKPLEGHPFRFDQSAVEKIIEVSGGYPYFIQFICRETYDFVSSFVEANPGAPIPLIPIEPIILKLDSDFFAARWNRVPDRQRELLFCIANLSSCDSEFTISEIVEVSAKIPDISKPFRYGDVSQMLPRLIDNGLVYKNRLGKYSFAVPLFGGFIRRQYGQH